MFVSQPHIEDDSNVQSCAFPSVLTAASHTSDDASHEEVDESVVADNGIG
jgi:hypothetical protein